MVELEFDTRREETDSIYLTEEEILQLLEVKDFDEPEHEVVRDIFALGCFAGMRFSDYSTIDTTAIRNNRLEFVQKKTGNKVTLPIHPVVNTILKNITRHYQKCLRITILTVLLNWLERNYHVFMYHLQSRYLIKEN